MEIYQWCFLVNIPNSTLQCLQCDTVVSGSQVGGASATVKRVSKKESVRK